MCIDDGYTSTGKNAEDGAVGQQQRIAVEQRHEERGDTNDDRRSVVKYETVNLWPISQDTSNNPRHGTEGTEHRQKEAGLHAIDA